MSDPEEMASTAGLAELHLSLGDALSNIFFFRGWNKLLVLELIHFCMGIRIFLYFIIFSSPLLEICSCRLSFSIQSLFPWFPASILMDVAWEQRRAFALSVHLEKKNTSKFRSISYYNARIQICHVKLFLNDRFSFFNYPKCFFWEFRDFKLHEH